RHPATFAARHGTAPPVPTGAPTTTTTTAAHKPVTSPAGTTGTGSTGTGTTGTASPVNARSVTLGDYAGESDPSGVAAFAAATGTHPVLATDYLDKTDGWAAMDSASNIPAWSHSPYRLVLGIPIIPGTGTLAQGATGAYDQYFTVLARNLIADDEGNAILRLGWEFNGNWFPWSVATAADAADFAAYWRQIVTTIRAVPGQHFQFLWNPNAPSPTPYTPDQAYPGDAYVDYVGTDVYDNYFGDGAFLPSVGWENQLQQQWGLDWLESFAAQHHKPIAIPEWSDEYRDDNLGFGDDPSFIDHMAAWFVSAKVAFADVWCYDSSATYRNNLLDGTFPKALAEFKLDFG
ncbi:MAG TPA: glycosyl hydrolase, partial [Acidimicrobiales bacterium]|nr:glycosyl hydrolase [Acidimicrobiales bacterium]